MGLESVCVCLEEVDEKLRNEKMRCKMNGQCKLLVTDQATQTRAAIVVIL